LWKGCLRRNCNFTQIESFAQFKINKFARRERQRIFEDARLLARPKNRFTARRQDRGGNLSVRFQIKNSISLTIAMLPRII
jgi:hypothetical protein